MTGLEPHPILRLPTREEAVRMGPAKCQVLLTERARRLELERTDPFRHGFEPEIWHVVDDLLVDGNKIILDLTRIAKVSANGKAPADLIDVPKEIAGAPEIWIAGSNRSTKSEYGGKKIMKVATSTPGARTWSFADKEEVSIARQQPLFWKYMPLEVKRRAEAAGGKFTQAGVTNVKYTQKNGFTQGTFVLPNGAQHWFKNYKQEESELEGDQLDAVWLDELRNPLVLKIIRTRMGDRGGIIIVTFTSVDDNYSGIVDEYEKGSRVVLEVDAELLPAKDENGEVTGKFEKVPRIAIAGPGSDGDQRANIVYFHITDNPYYGYEAALNIWRKTKRALRFGPERFYALYRNAIRSKILSRVYGILQATSIRQFPLFNPAIHVIDHDRIPARGTNYHIVDPVDGRNWFMLWIRIDARGRWFVYREWPSYSPANFQNPSPSAYIPGHGDLGPWALPGAPADGVQGPAQNPIGLGLTPYKQEILRCEGHQSPVAEKSSSKSETDDAPWWRAKPRKGLPHLPDVQSRFAATESDHEEIEDRYMDSRYGAQPVKTNEGDTTLIEQMGRIGMDFLATRASRGDSGSEIEEGRGMINEALYYDPEIPIGQFSPKLAGINEPQLFISLQCPNLIYSLKEWTYKDRGKGACKDPADCLRYAFSSDLEYIEHNALVAAAGGRY